MDSTEVIYLIQINSTEQHHSMVLRAIKDDLQLDWMIQTKHVFRERNKVVDGLAWMASSRSLGKLIYMQLSDKVLQLLHDDYSEITWTHIVGLGELGDFPRSCKKKSF